MFIDAPHVLQPVDLISAHARNPALGFEVQSNEQEIEQEQDPTLTPRAWWRPNPERTKGVGLEESIAVVRDVLKTRNFDVSVPLFAVMVEADVLGRASWVSGEPVYNHAAHHGMLMG